MLAFLAALTASMAKNPDLFPGTLIKPKYLHFLQTEL